MGKNDYTINNKIFKYLFEGIVIALLSFYIPKRKIKLDEIVALSITASTILIILDHYLGKDVRTGARFGLGFAVGSKLVGFPSENFDENQTNSPCNFNYNLVSNETNGLDCSNSGTDIENCNQIDAKTHSELCKNSSTPDNLNDWKDIRSKYCSLSGDKYSIIANSNLSKCLNSNDINQCEKSIINFSNSACSFEKGEKRETECGDLKVEGLEQCDNGNTNSPSCSFCETPSPSLD